MRADGRKYDMGKRLAILIGLAAAGVMALGAQTGAAASEDIVSYRTTVTAHKDSKLDWHGYVNSKVRKCRKGREVILFRKRPGPDRKLVATRSYLHHGFGEWSVVAPESRRVYAKVTPKVGDGFVCLADYSPVRYPAPN